MHNHEAEDKKPQGPSREPVRPFGVTLIGYAYIVLFGIQGLVSTVRILVKPEVRAEMMEAFKKIGVQIALSPENTEAVITSILYVQLFFSLLQLVLGVGVLRRQEWARVTIVYLVLASALCALLVSLAQPALAPFMVISLLYPAAVFWYCTKPAIKSWFKGE